MNEYAAPFPEKRLPPTPLLPQPRMAPWWRRWQPAPRSSRFVLGVLALASLLLVLLWLAGAGGHPARRVHALFRPMAASAAATAAPSVLECFQVAQPVLTPAGATTSRDEGPPGNGSAAACTVKLMEHVFGNSYGAPFVAAYTPPAPSAGCGSGGGGASFNRVVLNFTAVSQGRQFDRLALLFLGDAEIWRTSTAEPVAPPGIRWVFLLDATPYLALWRQPQTLTFHLGNLLNDKYTGSFNTTLTATFFSVPDGFESGGDGTAPPSDLVIPLSNRPADGAVTHFALPRENATVTVAAFPRHARRAVLSVSANGQADEEFWWQNVLSSDADAFRPTLGGALPGFGPFREVQVYVDGQLAGVQWPFPVVFTGGVVPSLHRPVVGLDVFALREHEIDLTPWLTLLGDGQPHTFAIRVVGIDIDEAGSAVLSETVGDSWYVTGKIFVWLGNDESDDGAKPEAEPSSVVPAPWMPTRKDDVRLWVGRERRTNATGAVEALHSTVSVMRSLQVSSGGTDGAVWTQTLDYWNEGVVDAFGFNQVNSFFLRGSDRAARWGEGKAEEEESPRQPYNDCYYGADYIYPLFCNTTSHIATAGNLSLWAFLDQGLALNVTGAAVFPTGLEAFTASGSASVLRSRFTGTASFAQTGDGRNSSGFGSSHQVFSFGRANDAADNGTIPLYTRDVTAVNGTVVADDETIAGRGRTATTAAVSAFPAAQAVFAPARDAGMGLRMFQGRGGRLDTEG